MPKPWPYKPQVLPIEVLLMAEPVDDRNALIWAIDTFRTFYGMGKGTTCERIAVGLDAVTRAMG